MEKLRGVYHHPEGRLCYLRQLEGLTEWSLFQVGRPSVVIAAILATNLDLVIQLS
jgi:hypothetical protein